MRKKVEVPAVADTDLRTVLMAYGLAEKMDKRELTCEHCDEPLAWENLGALLVVGQTLQLFCNMCECIEAASKGMDT